MSTKEMPSGEGEPIVLTGVTPKLQLGVDDDNQTVFLAMTLSANDATGWQALTNASDPTLLGVFFQCIYMFLQDAGFTRSECKRMLRQAPNVAARQFGGRVELDDSQDAMMGEWN